MLLKFAGGIIDRAEFRAVSMEVALDVQPLPSKWIPPSAELFKVNFDPSWSKDHGFVGIGVVAWLQV